MTIKLPSGVTLVPIPVSPNDDYMAGDDGQIYSRKSYKGFGRKQLVDWYPLAGHISNRGYLTITLCHESKKVTKSIHRLVCMAFHGMPEPKSLLVRHLDGDQTNNKPDNLTWGTQVENWHDRRSHDTAAPGERHHMSRLTDIERDHIKWAIDHGLCSRRQAARALGVSQPVVDRAVDGYKPGGVMAAALAKKPVEVVKQ
jgi:hypothetical protein